MASGPESELAESATLPPTKAPASSDDAGTLPPSGRIDPSITPRISSEQAAPLETPRAAPIVPGYEILGVLGQGGMGVVYKARHLKLHRLVALKMIRGNFIERQEQRQRFIVEAEAAARLQHAQIVQIFEIGDAPLPDGSTAPFMALEYIDGEPLDRYLQGKPLPAHAAAELVAELAQAMAFAHERHVIHRDLKPANVLLAKRDATGKRFPFSAKIGDFGLAKQIDVNSSQTKAGEIMGTPSYMAPEQAEGANVVGPSADIYALGAILYELLTGRPPFRAATALDTIFQVLSQDPVAPAKLQPGVPRDIETICLKCLEKPPAKRYASAAELADDLNRFLRSEPIRARPIGLAEKTWKWTKRRPAAAALIAVSVLALAALIAGGIWFTHAVRQERDAALSAEAHAQEAKTLAEDKAREAQKHLDQLSIATGLRLVDSGDLFGGLVWFTRPLRKDIIYRTHEPINRDRITYYMQYSQRPTLRHTFWHPAAVAHAAFSPDGRKVVTSSLDKTAQIWDAESGAPIGAPLQHEDAVIKSIFSPDSRLVVTLSGDKSAQLWHADTGKPHGPRLSHPDDVFDAEFSCDGKLLFTIASNSKMIFLWDSTSGKSIGTLEHPDEVNFATFSPDGRTIVAAVGQQDPRAGAPPGKSGSVHFWDAATRAPARPPIPFPAPAWHVNFSPDGTRLAIVRFDDRVQIFSLADPDSPPLEVFPRQSPRVARFTADGRRLVVFLLSRWAHVFDSATGKPVGQTIESNEVIRTYDVNPDGRTLVLGGDDKAIRQWNIETGLAVGPPLPQRDYVNFTTFSPDGRRLLAASSDHTVRLWDLAADQPRPLVHSHLGWIIGFAFSPDKSKIVATGLDKRMAVWDARTGDRLSPLILHPEPVKEAAFSHDRQWIVSAGFDGIARLWSASTFELIREFRGHEARPISCVRFSPDGGRLFTTCIDHTARIWDIATAECLHVMPHDGGVMAGDLSPDGTRFITGGQDNAVRVWNAVTGDLAYPPIAVHTKQVVDIRFSPDGRRFASASFDGTARVWDRATGHEIGHPRRHDSAVTKAVFSADGTRLATTSEDNTARIWDVETGQPVAPTLAHPAWPHDAEFSQDGTRLLTGMRRSAARFWNAQTGQPISPFIAHNSGRVLQASFTADESQFISCTSDGGLLFWPIPFNDRPSDDLIRLAEVYQGWRIDSFGGFSTIPADEFRALWDDMHERYPFDFAVSAESRRLWHWKEMKSALKEGKVYGALFHAFHLGDEP